MSKWEIAKLYEFCDINMGQSPESSSYNIIGDGIPFYQGNADFGELNPVAKYYCNKPTKMAKQDDILLSVRAPIGAINIANEVCCIGRGLAALSVKKNIADTKYVYYALKSKNQELNRKGTGSTFKAINKQSLSSTLCPLPPLEIQEQIAKNLDTASELLAMRRQQLAELDNLTKAVLYEMFGDPVINEKGWEIKKLKDVCIKITDGTHNSPKNFKSGRFKYITAKNIKKDGFDFSTLTFISEEDHKLIYNRCNPQFGDVLYIKDGVTTGIAQINSLTEEFSLLSSIALLKQDRRIINGFYLREVLNNEQMYNSIRRNMGGAAISRLTISKIEVIQIPVPPILEQNQFATIVAKIEEQKSLVQKAIDETQLLFDSLMSQYFDQ